MSATLAAEPRYRSMLDFITARRVIAARVAGAWAEDVSDAGVEDVEAYLDWATEAEAEGSPSSPWDYVAWMTPGDWDWDAAGSWYVGRHVADDALDPSQHGAVSSAHEYDAGHLARPEETEEAR